MKVSNTIGDWIIFKNIYSPSYQLNGNSRIEGALDIVFTLPFSIIIILELLYATLLDRYPSLVFRKSEDYCFTSDICILYFIISNSITQSPATQFFPWEPIKIRVYLDKQFRLTKWLFLAMSMSDYPHELVIHISLSCCTSCMFIKRFLMRLYLCCFCYYCCCYRYFQLYA